MATQRASKGKTTKAAPAKKAAATRAAPAKASSARTVGPARKAAKKPVGSRAAARPEVDEEHHRHERSVSIAATQHVVRSKRDGTIVARICVQSEHVLYGARDSKKWRRVTLGDFAAFMERAGELVETWDGGN